MRQCSGARLAYPVIGAKIANHRAEAGGQGHRQRTGPVALDDGTELNPDLLVLRQRADRYQQSNPTGDDTYLVIEVADTTLSIDRDTKQLKYARAGIRR